MLVGAAVGLVGALGIAGAVTAAVASPVQEDPSTTTRPEILVPGPTVGSSTTVAESTTTSAAAESLIDGLKQDVRDMTADETGRTVAIAIGGLILVALILAVLTIRYWRRTRPVRPPKATDG